MANLSREEVQNYIAIMAALGFPHCWSILEWDDKGEAEQVIAQRNPQLPAKIKAIWAEFESLKRELVPKISETLRELEIAKNQPDLTAEDANRVRAILEREIDGGNPHKKHLIQWVCCWAKFSELARQLFFCTGPVLPQGISDVHQLCLAEPLEQVKLQEKLGLLLYVLFDHNPSLSGAGNAPIG